MIKTSFRLGLLIYFTLGLSGCLEKSSTSVSLLSSLSLQAPKYDTNNPPDFDNVDTKNYVRIKGSCFAAVDRFQIQFTQAGVSTAWFDIPAAAPSDTRAAPVQTAYPLNPAEYVTNCTSSQGSFDFWVLTDQIDTWLSGNSSNVDFVNIRGISGTLPTEVLQLPSNSGGGGGGGGGGPTQEANNFQINAGMTRVGIGICQPLEINLIHKTGSSFNYNVTNSVDRNFALTMDGGFSLGGNLLIYTSSDCTTGLVSTPGFSVAAPATSLKLSYKMAGYVGYEYIHFATGSFGSLLNEHVQIFASSAGIATSLNAYNREYMQGNDCRTFSVRAMDASGLLTKQFGGSDQNVVATLSGASGFSFVTSCNAGTNLGPSVSVTFLNGVDAIRNIYVKTASGVSGTDEAVITLSQVSGLFTSTTLPTIYINPQPAGDHLSLFRLDSLNEHFNHECYPYQVSLMDASNSSIIAARPIDLRINTLGDIFIYSDANCSLLVNNNELSIPTGANSTGFYWSRRQANSLVGPSAGDTPTGFNIDFNISSPFLANPGNNTHADAQSMTLRRSPLDILQRSVQEISGWYFGTTLYTSDWNFVGSLSAPDLINPSSALYSSTYPAKIRYDATSGLEGRQIYREVFDLGIYGDPAYVTAHNSFFPGVMSAGGAFIMGGYFKLDNWDRQQLISNITKANNTDRYQLTLTTSGGLELYDTAGTPKCVTGGGVVTAGTWNSIFVKFAYNGSFSCEIFVNGISQVTDTVDDLSTYSPVKFGTYDPSERLQGSVVEMITDSDPSSSGDMRFSFSVMQSLHQNYFEQRYSP